MRLKLRNSADEQSGFIDALSVKREWMKTTFRPEIFIKGGFLWSNKINKYAVTPQSEEKYK